LKNSASDFADR